MWVSADGETHLKECYMKGFDVKSFAGDTPPQFVKEGSKPTKVRRQSRPPLLILLSSGAPCMAWMFYSIHTFWHLQLS